MVTPRRPRSPTKPAAASTLSTPPPPRHPPSAAALSGGRPAREGAAPMTLVPD